MKGDNGLYIIVAMGRNRVIGREEEIPWHLPKDMEMFKEKTSGHMVIMGRKTLEAMGSPLGGRENVVLTRDPGFEKEGCTVVRSVEEALTLARDKRAFVIGGGEIFEQFLPRADILYVTLIDREFSGDTYFPEIGKEWVEVKREKGPRNKDNPYDYYFIVYERGERRVK